MIQDRMKEIFHTIINTDLKYSGEIEDIDYFNLYCKAATDDHVYKLLGANFFMLNYKYEGSKSVLMVFSIPINSESGTKHIAERVMEIIENTERCFVTLDYSSSIENKDDKFVYVTIVKKYDNDFIQSLSRETVKKQPPKKVKKTKKKEEKSESEKVKNDSEVGVEEGSKSVSDNNTT